jgi:hypothetical protein
MFKRIFEAGRDFLYATQFFQLTVTGEQQLKPCNSLEELESVNVKTFKSPIKVEKILNLFGLELLYAPINFDQKCALYCARHVEMDCDYEAFESQIEYLGGHSFRHFEAFIDPEYGMLSIQDLGDRFDARLFKRARNDKYFINLDGHCVIAKGKLESFKTVFNTSLLEIVAPIALYLNSSYGNVGEADPWFVQQVNMNFFENADVSRNWGADMSLTNGILYQDSQMDEVLEEIETYISNEEEYIDEVKKFKHGGALILHPEREKEVMIEKVNAYMTNPKARSGFFLLNMALDGMFESSTYCHTFFHTKKEISEEEVLFSKAKEHVDIQFDVNLEILEITPPELLVEYIYAKKGKDCYYLLTPFESLKIVRGERIFHKESLPDPEQKDFFSKHSNIYYNYCTSAKYAIKSKNVINKIVEECNFDVLLDSKLKCFVNGVKINATNTWIVKHAALAIINVNKNFISPVLDRHFSKSVISALVRMQRLGKHLDLGLDFHHRKDLTVEMLYKNYLKGTYVTSELFISPDHCFTDSRGVKHDHSVEWITSEFINSGENALKNIMKENEERVEIYTEDEKQYIKVNEVRTRYPISYKRFFYLRSVQKKNPILLETYDTLRYRNGLEVAFA